MIRQRGRHRRSERGAVLVEAAIVLPILMTFVFGIIDFGGIYSDQLAVRSGTQQATRFAATASFGSSTNCPMVGTITPVADQKVVCRVKSLTGLSSQTDIRVSIQIPTTYTVGEALIVCTEYPVKSNSGFFRPLLGGRVLKSKSTHRIEGVNSTTPLSNASETSLSGSWSWCS